MNVEEISLVQKLQIINMSRLILYYLYQFASSKCEVKHLDCVGTDV